MGQRGIGAKPVKRKPGSTGKPPRRREAWRKRGLSRVERVIVFVESLMITSGPLAGSRFKLRPWQVDFLVKVYATDAKGRRIVRMALLTMGRKNGKTALVAALALCHLVGPEAEPRGQVYSAASDRAQAALIYAEMVAMIRADAVLSSRIIIREHSRSLEDTDTGSRYFALASDARKAQGLGPSFWAGDEVAQWRGVQGRALLDALSTGGGARSEPLGIVISTQSHDPNHPMSELVRYGRGVLDGSIVDPSFAAAIFEAEEGDDPWDEAVWYKANPGLGDFRSLDEMRVAAAQAKAVPSKQPAFENLYLNRPVSPTARFISAKDWKACRAEIGPMGLAGARCILGIDLSSTTDLTAAAAFFPSTGDLKVWFWMPAENVAEAERRDQAPYGQWIKEGLIVATGGRAVDKRAVALALGKMVVDYDVQFAAADRWRLDELERILGEEGIKLRLEPFGQGWRDMSPAVEAFETAVLRGELRQPGHPVLDFNLASAVTVSDGTGARKLVKDRSTGRIDGLVAAVMAVGAAARTAPKPKSVYLTRGLVTLGTAA